MRSQIENAIRQRAAVDDAFRAELVADPNAALTALLGVAIPQTVRITVVEETAGELVLALPPTERRELSDQELDTIEAALGDSPNTFYCDTPRHAGQTGSGYGG